jgi:hypothetical protein
MTDYVRATNFTAKDSLPSGSALKVAKGADIDAEFDVVAAAVATKVDETGGTLTGGTIAGTTTLSGTLSGSGTIDGGSY